MFTYPEAVNSTSTTKRPVRCVSGQYVARAHLNREQRAELAAGLADGSVELILPTLKQSATLVGVPIVDVSKVRRTNGNGRVKPKPNDETLVQHITRSSLAERIEAARDVGIDVVWDTMIAPLIGTEQAAAE